MIYVNDSAESGMGRRRIFRVHVQYTFFVSLFVVIFLLYVFFLSVVLKPIGIENGRACPIINGRYAYTFPMAGVEQSLKPDKHISRQYTYNKYSFARFPIENGVQGKRFALMLCSCCMAMLVDTMPYTPNNTHLCLEINILHFMHLDDAEAKWASQEHA